MLPSSAVCGFCQGANYAYSMCLYIYIYIYIYIYVYIVCMFICISGICLHLLCQAFASPYFPIPGICLPYYLLNTFTEFSHPPSPASCEAASNLLASWLSMFVLQNMMIINHTLKAGWSGARILQLPFMGPFGGEFSYCPNAHPPSPCETSGNLQLYLLVSSFPSHSPGLLGYFMV